MGDKILSRAFDLAKQAGAAEHEGNLAKARDLLAASIEAFRAVLLMPGFIGDERTRNLLETEITNLQKKKALMLGNASEVKKLEARLDKLANPGNQDALQERLTHLKGLDKPGITQDELASRLKILKGEDGSSGVQAPPPTEQGVFAGDDWKRGLDPDLIELIEQAKDETRT